MKEAIETSKRTGAKHALIVPGALDSKLEMEYQTANVIDCLREMSEIAAFHVGDNPGRKEPGTGEINYRNIFKHIHQKGYDGVLCMEHGKSLKGIEGEKALIEAYRKVDNF